MVNSIRDRVGRWLDRLRPPRGPSLSAPPLAQRRVVIDLGPAWPWLSLLFIIWLHRAWTADQIAELLAVFTPYSLLVAPSRQGGSGGTGDGRS